MNGNSVAGVKIEGGGEGVVAHVGRHALGWLADRLGGGGCPSARIPPAGERFPLHDRGKVLVQAMLMLAGRGEACTDIEVLLVQETLFGFVPVGLDVVPHVPPDQPRDAVWFVASDGQGPLPAMGAQRRDDGHRAGGVGHRHVAGAGPFRAQGRHPAGLQGRGFDPMFESGLAGSAG